MTPWAWLRAEDAQTMTEYALVLALTLLVLIGAFTSFGQAVLKLYEGAKAVMP
jgi:Flp pilus assembly pilin Flp